jgi:hypothetical protein
MLQSGQEEHISILPCRRLQSGLARIAESDTISGLEARQK